MVLNTALILKKNLITRKIIENKPIYVRQNTYDSVDLLSNPTKINR